MKFNINKKIIFTLVFLFQVFALAEFDEMVFIQGRIGNAFDKKQVKVIDRYNQTYYLSKFYFSKNFKFKEGQIFNIEIPLEEYKALEMKKAQDY